MNLLGLIVGGRGFGFRRASGHRRVRRISLSHPAKFIMVDREPGGRRVRPQLLDRFGMKVSVAECTTSIRERLVMNKIKFDEDPKAYQAECGRN